MILISRMRKLYNIYVSKVWIKSINIIYTCKAEQTYIHTKYKNFTKIWKFIRIVKWKKFVKVI